MHFPRVRVRVRVRVRGRVRVRVKIFKDETELIFMQIVTQNDEIEVAFTPITFPSLHFEYPLGLGLGLGLGLSVYPKG